MKRKLTVVATLLASIVESSWSSIPEGQRIKGTITSRVVDEAGHGVAYAAVRAVYHCPSLGKHDDYCISVDTNARGDGSFLAPTDGVGADVLNAYADDGRFGSLRHLEPSGNVIVIRKLTWRDRINRKAGDNFRR
jgi:nitrogen fixation protein FixH